MSVRVRTAVAAAKSSRGLIRLLGKGGSTFPGKLALRLCPDVLGELAKDIHCIVVTGTNGKTTTSRMVEQMLKDSGRTYFCNKSGANLLTGITAEFANNAKASGKKRKDWALIECDEAAFKTVSKYVDPEYVIVTNVFRDQLDRYGEITHTLENIVVGVKNSKNAVLCLNADCSMTASIAKEVDNKILFYGVNGPIYKERVHEASDAPYCINCKHEYEYEYITFGHLGKYRCPYCGYSRPEPDVAVTHVEGTDEKGSRFTLKAFGKENDVTLNLPGGYNIYNAAAASCLAQAMGIDAETAIPALSDFEVGFGRMEEFELNGVSTRMILIKNPAGCNQVLNFLSNLSEPSVFVVGLNDNFADGTDISWIWDVDFETLPRIEDKITKVYVTGIRAYDMATRLKYAGIKPEVMEVETDYDKLLDDITSQDLPVYIMPTYTCMMDFRAIVSKKYGLKNFWE